MNVCLKIALYRNSQFASHCRFVFTIRILKLEMRTDKGESVKTFAHHKIHLSQGLNHAKLVSGGLFSPPKTLPVNLEGASVTSTGSARRSL